MMPPKMMCSPPKPAAMNESPYDDGQKSATPPITMKQVPMIGTTFTEKVKVRVFRGRLATVPRTDVATTLQRAYHYRLGRQMIYTGGTNNVLNRLVGKEVEIQGKLIEMELEGQLIREIWPGAVRATKDTDNARKP